MGREEIFHLRSRDPNGIISTHNIEPTTTTYFATKRSWNGYGYECYFCHREFGRLHGLNQHLSSPVRKCTLVSLVIPSHFLPARSQGSANNCSALRLDQEVLYHCPTPRCRIEFKTLAAIINHLESETSGAMRFDAVQRRIGDIVSGKRLLRF
jgi:hypothetical protein